LVEICDDFADRALVVFFLRQVKQFPGIKQPAC
jgi:hypothetical protein